MLRDDRHRAAAADTRTGADATHGGELSLPGALGNRAFAALVGATAEPPRPVARTATAPSPPPETAQLERALSVCALARRESATADTGAPAPDRESAETGDTGAPPELDTGEIPAVVPPDTGTQPPPPEDTGAPARSAPVASPAERDGSDTGTAPPDPERPRTPTVEDPSSGVDWSAVWVELGINLTRSVLEVGRVWPGLGLISGAAADVINGYQDIAQIAPVVSDSFVDSAIVATLLVRDGMNLVNQALGHLAYVNQLVHDGTVVTVVFIAFAPVEEITNDLIKLVKVIIDLELVVMDSSLSAVALYKAANAEEGSDAQKRWMGMSANYYANIHGGLISTFVDVLDAFSGGFTNAEVIKQGAGMMRNLLNIATRVWPHARNVLLGMWNVWGGNILGGIVNAAESALARSASDVVTDAARDAAAAVILREATEIKFMYELGDQLLGSGAEMVKQRIAEYHELATLALDGRDPFITARDATVEGLQAMETRMAQLTEMADMSGNAEEKAQAVLAMCDDALVAIETLALPDIEIPEAELGEGAVADAAESVVNLGGSVANAGVQALVDQLDSAVEVAKDALRVPVETLRANTNEIGEFLQILTAEGRRNVEEGQLMIADVREQLAQCEGAEDVFNLLIDQIFEMMGIESEFEIEDARQAWRDLGPLIDRTIAWAEGGLVDSGDGPEPRMDGGAPIDDDEDPA
jgi:hypothetical protein